MTALDLCQAKYQILLITYLKFTKKNAKDARKENQIKLVCDFIGLKINKLQYKCNKCKKRQLKPKNGLIKKFPGIYQFYNEDINKSILLLRKGVYPSKYMDSWERFGETSYQIKNLFTVNCI